MSYIGRYEIVRRLKGGGMGSVTLARAPDGDLVILKSPYDPDPDACERLRDEARVGARLLHPAIVETLDLFEHEGAPVLVVSFVDGLSLEQLRDYGPMPTALVARVGRQMAEALDALHRATNEAGELLNILHRDVSPGNIMVDRSGDACLIDLGIARFDDRRADKTQAGFLRGTMRYLAPELIQGASYSWRSDLWSLGMVLWEAALGHFAYPADTDRDIVVAILEGRPMSHGGDNVAPELKDAIAPMLAPDPAQRVGSAAEVAARLKIVEEVFEDARATTAEAIQLVVDKRSELADTQAHPVIGAGPSMEATESFSIPHAPGPAEIPERPPVAEEDLGDFGEDTEAVIDIPRPVTFVGAHPLPELRDAPLDPPSAEDSAPTRISEIPPSLAEPDSLPSAEAVEIPRDVSVVAAAPAGWTEQETVTDFGIAGDDPFPVRSEDHPRIGPHEVTPPPEVTPPLEYEEEEEEPTVARGPPVAAPMSDEYLEVDLDVPEISVLDEVRAQVEPTRVLENFVPDDGPGALDISIDLDADLDPSDPRARAPEAESLDVEPLAPLEPAEPTEIRVDESLHLEPHEEIGDEPTQDISLPGAEPAAPNTAGPRLSGRRRPSSQYITVSSARQVETVGAEPVSAKEMSGDVPVARIGLKRVAVRRDGRRVEIPGARISVKAVPRIPDSDKAESTAVQTFSGTPGFEQPEELNAEAFVRPRGRTQPGAASPFLVEAAPAPAAHTENTEISKLNALSVDDDDEEDEGNERMSLDDVLDILDD